MLKWIKYLKLIPTSVQVSKNRKFEVLWIDEFNDSKRTLGETRVDYNQIVIKSNRPVKETVHTYFHEVLHAISDEYEAELSEKQVMALEKALYYILKHGNMFSRSSKRGKK